MVKIVICDDSKDYSQILKCKINNCIQDNFKVEYSLECFYSLDEFKDYIDSNEVDIVFLDILVNDVNAVDWSLDNIKSGKTQFIFMTSYPQSAYNISETYCCYFIIKPKLTDDMLKSALARALRNLSTDDKNLITIRQKNKHIAINCCEIVYIESIRNNIEIHMKSGDILTVFSTLKKFDKMLPPLFLRCHKSFLVNMRCVKECHPSEFILNTEDETKIPIPPKKYKNILESYEKYINNR